MARPGANPRTRFRRLTLTVNAKPAASTASIPLIQIDNLDSGANIANVTLANLHLVFKTLGFDVVFNYSPPTGGA